MRSIARQKSLKVHIFTTGKCNRRAVMRTRGQMSSSQGQEVKVKTSSRHNSRGYEADSTLHVAEVD